MLINKILLNYYSFGYSSGLIIDEENSFKKINLENIINLNIENKLNGIEFPFDRIYSYHNIDNGIEKIQSLINKSIKVFIDFETLDYDYLLNIIPKLANLGINIIRIKMNHLGKVFYGGNRYNSPHFENSLISFKSDLKKIVPILNDNSSIAVIENHQDLHSIELKQIIEDISIDSLGVNWDIGNAFSVCDTPETFFENTKHLIKNVHIKDYKISKSKKGILLTRCKLGSGSVNFNDIFTKLKSIENQLGSLSIELGAQISRDCHINLEEYWEPYSKLDINRKYYTETVLELSEDYSMKSDYENGLRGSDLKMKEIDDVNISIHQINTILRNLR